MLGKEIEYIKLLEIFIQVVEANKGKPVGSDEWILDAECRPNNIINQTG